MRRVFRAAIAAAFAAALFLPGLARAQVEGDISFATPLLSDGSNATAAALQALATVAGTAPLALGGTLGLVDDLTSTVSRNATFASGYFWNSDPGVGLNNHSDTLNSVAGIAMALGSAGNAVVGIAGILETTTCGAMAFATGGSSLGNTVPDRIHIYCDGGVTFGTPTGLSKGSATLNLAGALYDNGTAPTGTAGSGYVRATSPVLATPTLGVASATSLAVTGSGAPANGIYLPAASTAGIVGASAIEFLIGASNKFDIDVTTAGTITAGLPTTINSATFKVTTLAAATAIDVVCYSTATGLFTEEPTGTGCTVSDETKKVGLRAIDLKRSLAIVLASSPISYYYVPELQDSDYHLGFGAQTMARIAPELVHYEHGKPAAIKQLELLPITWAAIKQLEADNEALRAAVAYMRRQ